MWLKRSTQTLCHVNCNSAIGDQIDKDIYLIILCLLQHQTTQVRPVELESSDMGNSLKHFCRQPVMSVMYLSNLSCTSPTEDDVPPQQLLEHAAVDLEQMGSSERGKWPEETLSIMPSCHICRMWY